MTSIDFYESEVFGGEVVYWSQQTEPLQAEQPNRVWRNIQGLATAITVLACVWWFPVELMGSAVVRSDATLAVRHATDERWGQTQEQEGTTIDALTKLQAGWDGYEAPAPNRQAATLAKFAIGIASAEGIIINRIVPAGEGGIALCFIHGEKYADIECLNDGETFSALSDGHEYREVVQVRATDHGLKKATQRIGKFLGT